MQTLHLAIWHWIMRCEVEYARYSNTEESNSSFLDIDHGKHHFQGSLVAIKMQCTISAVLFFFILHQVVSHRLYNKDFNHALNININFFIFFFYFFVTLFIAFFIYYNFFSFLSFYLYTLQPCSVTPFVGY